MAVRCFWIVAEDGDIGDWRLLVGEWLGGMRFISSRSGLSHIPMDIHEMIIP